MKGGDDEDRPKRRKTCPFGPLVSFFFLIYSFFFVLNGSFILCTGYKLRNTHVKSGDNENGPKRRETHRLGH